MNKTCLAAVGVLLLAVMYVRMRPSPPCPPAEQPAPQPLPRKAEAPAPIPQPAPQAEAPAEAPPSPVVPMGTPTLRMLQPYELTYKITENADRILREHHTEPLGSGYRFFVGQALYLGRLEWSYNEPGGEKRPWGYNVGVTVYKFEFP